MRSPRVKRVYLPAAPEDGRRILVDALWPRGLTKQRAAIDRWLKAIAPSHELRRWYGHDPARWPEFERRYAAELDAMPQTVADLRTELASGPCTLLFGSKEERYNNAVALARYLGAYG